MAPTAGRRPQQTQAEGTHVQDVPGEDGQQRSRPAEEYGEHVQRDGRPVAPCYATGSGHRRAGSPCSCLGRAVATARGRNRPVSTTTASSAQPASTYTHAAPPSTATSRPPNAGPITDAVCHDPDCHVAALAYRSGDTTCATIAELTGPWNALADPHEEQAHVHQRHRCRGERDRRQTEGAQGAQQLAGHGDAATIVAIDDVPGRERQAAGRGSPPPGPPSPAPGRSACAGRAPSRRPPRPSGRPPTPRKATAMSSRKSASAARRRVRWEAGRPIDSPLQRRPRARRRTGGKDVEQVGVADRLITYVQAALVQRLQGEKDVQVGREHVSRQ